MKNSNLGDSVIIRGSINRRNPVLDFIENKFRSSRNQEKLITPKAIYKLSSKNGDTSIQF